MTIAERLRNEVNGLASADVVRKVQMILGVLALLRLWVTLGQLRQLLPTGVIEVPWAGWLPDLDGGLLPAALFVWLVAAVLFAAGVRPRLSGAALALAMATVFGMDQQLYANHFYLMIVLVALAALATPPKGGEASNWPLLLMKIQITVVYVFGSITKVNDVWLSGEVFTGFVGKGLVELPEFLTTGWVAQALSVAVVAVELALAAGLWFERTRLPTVALGIVFHLSIALFMNPVLMLVVFSGQMMATYLVFMSPPRPAPTHSNAQFAPAV